MLEDKRKVMVIGLDAAPPELVFNRWREELPYLNKLINQGSYGPMKSTIPPITCPAWMSMMTGMDAGQLGFYGFRNRRKYNYQEMSLVNSRWVKEKKVWDILGLAGKKSILLGVPQTYPPKKINGIMVSGFLTPGTEFNFTYPAYIKKEIEEVVDDYIFDVERGSHQQELEQIYQMTEKRFQLAEYFLDNHQWDFFMMVEMGTDRIQHFFWKYFDHSHPNYQEGNPFQEAIKEYYQYVDKQLGRILEYADEDTLVMVVSDHGAQKMTAGFAINQWLKDKGYLVLKENLAGITPVDELKIDWAKTSAWGYGGYYGRIFLNVKDREPAGIIPNQQYEEFRDKIIDELEEFELEKGNSANKLSIKNNIYKPEDIYAEVNNIAPDLMVYFNDLAWRSIGSLGHDSYIIPADKLEPYSANHTKQGILISNQGNKGYMSEIDIKDIVPSILGYYGIDIPAGLQGKNIFL